MKDIAANTLLTENTNTLKRNKTAVNEEAFRKGSQPMFPVKVPIEKAEELINESKFNQIKKSSQSASADGIVNLMKKGLLKDNTKFFYSFKDFDYVKLGSKNHQIGSGAFADVFLVLHRMENRKYAIKVMNKTKLKSNNIKEGFIRKEIDIHSKLDHPYIISVKCYHETNEEFYIIMDYAKNGSLFSKIRKMPSGFSEDSAFKYFIQTVSAIYFLQKNRFCHRDLKPENILLDENNNIKLSDFGWCESLDKPLIEFCGTYEYMAPEIVKQQQYTEKVDNWALGVLLYELVHGKSPFIDQNYSKTNDPKIIFKNILSGKFEMKQELSDNIKSLISGMFN